MNINVSGTIDLGDFVNALCTHGNYLAAVIEIAKKQLQNQEQLNILLEQLNTANSASTSTTSVLGSSEDLNLPAKHDGSGSNPISKEGEKGYGNSLTAVTEIAKIQLQTQEQLNILLEQLKTANSPITLDLGSSENKQNLPPKYAGSSKGSHGKRTCRPDTFPDTVQKLDQLLKDEIGYRVYKKAYANGVDNARSEEFVRVLVDKMLVVCNYNVTPSEWSIVVGLIREAFPKDPTNFFIREDKASLIKQGGKINGVYARRRALLKKFGMLAHVAN